MCSSCCPVIRNTVWYVSFCWIMHVHLMWHVTSSFCSCLHVFIFILLYIYSHHHWMSAIVRQRKVQGTLVPHLFIRKWSLTKLRVRVSPVVLLMSASDQQTFCSRDLFSLKLHVLLFSSEDVLWVCGVIQTWVVWRQHELSRLLLVSCSNTFVMSVNDRRSLTLLTFSCVMAEVRQSSMKPLWGQDYTWCCM